MRDLRSNEDETLDVVDGVVLECEGVGIYQSLPPSITHFSIIAIAISKEGSHESLGDVRMRSNYTV